MEELIGQYLGQYRIIEQVGQGGMATVFKARQPRLDRWVAVKVLPPAYGADADFRRRFMREARAIAHLEHPHILPVYDFGQQGPYIYLVMRYIEDSRTLTEVMAQPLTYHQILRYLEQVAVALDYAHERSIVHRDIKPSNILLHDDWVFLGDFGLAYMVEASTLKTTTSLASGTPAYMSPEQGSGGKVDTRTDVYALGVIAYEMLTGQIPHEADTPQAVIYRRNHEPVPSLRDTQPAIPLPVERSVQQALALDPDERFQTAGEFVEALRTAILEANVANLVAAPPEPPVAVPDRSPPLAGPVCARCGADLAPDQVVCDNCGEFAAIQPATVIARETSRRLWWFIGIAGLTALVLLGCLAIWLTPRMWNGNSPIVSTDLTGTPPQPDFTSTPLAPVTAELFSEEFEGIGLDRQVWDFTLGTGQIQVNDGVLRLTSRGQSFPLVYTKENPFPAEGNFSLNVSLRYLSAEERGTGFRVDVVEPDQTGQKVPGTSLIAVWQDDTSWRILFGPDGQRVYAFTAPNLDPHDLEITYLNETYHFILDGEPIYVSEPTPLRPNLMWIGNPAQANAAGAWSDLEINDISIKALADVIASVPTATSEPVSSPTPTSPAPTATSTEVVCSNGPAAAVADLWEIYRNELGCPVGELQTIPTIAEETFEGGHLYWRNDNDQVYIILDRARNSGEALSTGEWTPAKPDWRWDGSNPDGVGLSPPAGLVEPKRGFGWLWRNHLGAENGPLGWALDREYGFDNTGRSQQFEHGLMFKGSGSKIYVLLDDGTFYVR